MKHWQRFLLFLGAVAALIGIAAVFIAGPRWLAGAISVALVGTFLALVGWEVTA